MAEMKSLTLKGKKYDGFEGTVRYKSQELTAEQKAQARKNIGAVDEAKVETIVNNALGKADLADYQLIGQTPQYLSGADTKYNLILDINDETEVSIVSDTVADMVGAINASFGGSEETEENGVYNLVCKSTNAWYTIKKQFDLNGLTVGETYNLIIDQRNLVVSDVAQSGYVSFVKVTGLNGSNLVEEMISATNGMKLFSFTADSEKVTVLVYPVSSNFTPTNGHNMRYRGIWINKSDAKEVRTEVYKFNTTVSERLDLKNICGGVTITTTPSVNVYTQTIEGDEPDGNLKGKTCVCFGDSITGNYASPTDYPSVIARKTGMTVVNGGFGGCRMAQHPSSAYTAFSMHSLADSVASGDWSVQDAAVDSVTSANAAEHLDALKAVDWSAVDYITIFYGTNDFTGGVALDNDSNPLSTSQFKGALRYSIETILTAYPRIRIAVVTPMYRYWTEDGTVTDSDVLETGNLKLTDFVEAAIDVAKEYKVPAFDTYHQLGVNKINRATFLSDGTHPSGDGIERIGEYLAAKLISM